LLDRAIQRHQGEVDGMNITLLYPVEIQEKHVSTRGHSAVVWYTLTLAFSNQLLTVFMADDVVETLKRLLSHNNNNNNGR